MHFTVIFRILGILLMVFSLTLFPPMLVSLWYHDHNHMAFLAAFAITFVTGLLIWFPAHRSKQDLRTRDGFLITALFWSVLGLFGSLPLLFSSGLELSLTDAVFESLSGLTTTGATVISGLDVLPNPLLPPATAVAGWHRYRGDRSGGTTHAGCRWHAALPR